MAFILSIETSTSVCSVALHQDGKLLSALEVHQEYSHASKLGVLIKDVMKLADTDLNKLNAVALSSGPGSYTGLRIGTSLAKGICYALDIPMIAVPTLKIMATSISRLHPEVVSFCPMIDARRMEVYCQLFNRDLVEIEKVQAIVVDSRSFEHYLDNGPVVFFGSGAAKCKSVIVHANARFLENVNPLASQMGELGYSKFRHGRFEDIIQFVPLYLKEFFIRKPVDA
jgi:tRNA threonylcarbamoyladenosine biosynthesis protein TsaB